MKVYKKPPSIPFTKAGYQKLIDEKNILLEQRPPAVKELQRAREMGDLKENGFYRGARWKLSGIDRRLRELNHQIKYAHIIEVSSVQEVTIGATVLVSDGQETHSFALVGEFEANPSEKKLSHKSPIGKALLGKKVGEKVTVKIPSGEISYTIVEVKID
jgi:transcription elongation factor GreA